jgi:hypothetical protein
MRRWDNDHVLKPDSATRLLLDACRSPPRALKLILIMLIFTGRLTSTVMIGCRECRYLFADRQGHVPMVSVGTDGNINPSLNFAIEPRICVPAVAAVHSVGYECSKIAERGGS